MNHLKIRYRAALVLLLLFMISLSAAWVRHLRYLSRERHRHHSWSIGWLEGLSPESLQQTHALRNPIIFPEMVSSTCILTADPFLTVTDSAFYCFFEIKESDTGNGVIGCSVNSGYGWQYLGVALKEPYHLSFPFTYEENRVHYLIPETSHDSSVRLYREEKFPLVWKLDTVLLKGRAFVDPVLFKYEGRFWIFAGIVGNRELRLYFSENLRGPWKEHPASPVVPNSLSFSRPAGRVVESGGKLLRFAQDDSLVYGNAIHTFQISKLTPETYSEQRLPDFAGMNPSGKGWNRNRMHTIDAHRLRSGRWLAVTDGDSSDEGESRRAR